MIGDIIEQYQLGRSLTWYRRQVLAVVAIGSTTHVWTHSRRALRALVPTFPWLFATAGLLLLYGIPNHGGLTVLFNMLVFVYCSVGVGVLLLTITCSDDSVSFTIVECTPLG